MNATPALIVNIQRQPGANVIQVVDGIKTLLPTLTSSLPQAITITPLTDRTMTIRASVSDVEFELTLAVALVVLVIFLFLRNIPATIIPSLSVPLSLVGALAIMYQFDFSLDNLSLMALTVATGFVVDDAIVVIENISRYLEEGDTPQEAALKGSQQIGFTIISLTVSLIAVLIPLLFMGDVVGRLFHEFAITLAATIVISAFVSLTLVPMMCAKLLRPERARRAAVAVTPPAGASSRRCRALRAGAQRRARPPADDADRRAGDLRAHRLPLCDDPQGLLSRQDTGVIQGVTQAAQAISFDKMAERAAGARRRDPHRPRRRQPVLVHRRRRLQRHAQFRPLPDQPEAARSSARRPPAEIIRRLQQETADVAGIALYMQPVQDLSIDTAVSATQYQFTLDNQDLALLQNWTPKVLERLAKIPDIVDVASDLQPNGRVGRWSIIDRASAARFGITPATIDNALYDAFGQRIISTIFTQSNQYRVILDIDPAMTRSLDVAELDLSAVVRLDDRSGAAQRDRHVRGQAVAAADLAPQAVPGDDDLVQPRARRLARRRRSTRSTRRWTTSACRRASPSTSRARRRRSSRRCRTRCSCCWRRC